MKPILLSIVVLCFSVTALATPLKINTQQLEKMAHVMSLLGQPMSKQEQCAKLGYIGYQNALSASYMSGIHGANTKNPVKAYAWNLVAYQQILTTKNKVLINEQQKAMHFVSKKLQLTPAQKHEANKMSNAIIHQYSAKWPNANASLKSVVTTGNFPKPCDIK